MADPGQSDQGLHRRLPGGLNKIEMSSQFMTDQRTLDAVAGYFRETFALFITLPAFCPAIAGSYSLI